MASTTAGQGQVFIGPGLSPFKRIVTIIAVLGITALVLWIAVHQGAGTVDSCAPGSIGGGQHGCRRRVYYRLHRLPAYYSACTVYNYAGAGVPGKAQPQQGSDRDTLGRPDTHQRGIFPQWEAYRHHCLSQDDDASAKSEGVGSLPG